MRVTFVLPEPRPLAELERLDPDRDWTEFVTTTRAWILQTFLRLRAAGDPVLLSGSIPEDGVAVLGAGDYHALLSSRIKTRALLVSVRGSHRRTPPFADVEVVQNPVQADGRRRFFMPHWPQPGLLPRDPERGARIERIGYKGFPDNLHESFRSERWRSFLAAEGIEWVDDSVPYADLATPTAGLCWQDFRALDLVVAVRPHDRDLHPGRPATKLYNAWLAGVPALLGRESAYLAIRRHDDDYLEVRDADEAAAAILALRRDPERYATLAERARERAADFTVDRTADRWRALLFDTLPRLADQLRIASRSPKSLAQRQLAGRCRWFLAANAQRLPPRV